MPKEDCDFIKINEIFDLKSRSNLMLTKFEARNVHFHVFDDGSIGLKIKSLNFWKKNQ